MNSEAIAQALGIKPWQVNAVLKLLQEGESACGGGGSHTQTDSIDDEVLRFGKHLLTNFVPFLV